MELQPIVGAACAHCHDKILVDLDGRNCRHCGLATHRRCSKAHRAQCANRPALAREAHDYDEVKPLTWNARLTSLVTVGVFGVAFGLGMLLNDPAPDASGRAATPAGDAQPAPPRNRTRMILEFGALGAGLVIGAGGFVWERSRQRSTTP